MYKDLFTSAIGECKLKMCISITIILRAILPSAFVLAYWKLKKGLKQNLDDDLFGET